MLIYYPLYSTVYYCTMYCIYNVSTARTASRTTPRQPHLKVLLLIYWSSLWTSVDYRWISYLWMHYTHTYIHSLPQSPRLPFIQSLTIIILLYLFLSLFLPPPFSSSSLPLFDTSTSTLKQPTQTPLQTSLFLPFVLDFPSITFTLCPFSFLFRAVPFLSYFPASFLLPSLNVCECEYESFVKPCVITICIIKFSFF